MQDDTEEKTKEACRFKRDVLSLCSGLSDTSFGYSEGKPCVLLKMNRVKPIFRPSVCPCTSVSCSLTSPARVVSQIIGLMPRGDPHINCMIKVNRPSDGERHTCYLFCSFFFHKFPLISLSFLPFFCLCLISFCMLSLTALG